MKNFVYLITFLSFAINYGQFIPNGNLSSGLSGYSFQGQANQSMTINSNNNLIQINNYETGNFNITTPELYLVQGGNYKLSFRFLKTLSAQAVMPPMPPMILCKLLPEIVLVDQNSTELPLIPYNSSTLNQGCNGGMDIVYLETVSFTVPLNNVYRIRLKKNTNFSPGTFPYLLGDFSITSSPTNNKISGFFNPNAQTCSNGILPVNGTVKIKVTNANNQSFYVYPNSQNGYYEVNNLTNETYNLQAITTSNFLVDETPISVTLDNTNPTFTKNYCLVPNGTFNDLQVFINTLNPAIPGSQANYKIDYKNAGTSLQNGTIDLQFPYQKMTLLSSSIPYTNLGNGNLQFSLGSINAFTQGSFNINFQLNTPTHSTHPLNSGNLLNFNTQIFPQNSDINPIDNQFTLNQIVVNSYDPNDKIVLEGAVLPTSKIGNYIHYRIRFENTGTFNAQNVIIKDIIDISKLDINNVEIVNNSHPCSYRINGNELFFDFKNINLSFDDANNDGFVIFKIKIKSEVLASETINNSANIYFDFNLPILTNTFLTTFDNTMSLEEEFINNMLVYPNPAKNFVTIDSLVDALKVYNSLGQEVVTKSYQQQNQTKVDLSSFSNGIYFIKISINDLEKTIKIIKE